MNGCAEPGAVRGYAALAAKQALRREFLAKRMAVDASSRLAAEEYALRLLDGLLVRIHANAVVAAYWAKEDEFPTRRIVSLCIERGHAVAMPRWDVALRSYSWALFMGEDKLVPGKMAILEPDSGCRAVGDAEIGLYVVPGIVFDREGFRIGYGGGFFDGLLAKAPHGSIACGVCFPCQVFSGRLPRLRHDIPVDAILTEGASASLTHIVDKTIQWHQKVAI